MMNKTEKRAEALYQASLVKTLKPISVICFDGGLVRRYENGTYILNEGMKTIVQWMDNNGKPYSEEI